MDPLLGREEAVGVLAAGDEGRGLDPRLLARERLLHLDLEATLLRPAQVHAQEHLGPVLGVGPARSAVHRHDCVAGVVVAAEEARLLELAELALDVGELLGELRLERVVTERREVGEIRYVRLELAEALELALGAAVLGGDGSGALAVVPEAGFLHLALEPGNLLVERSGVKDNPRAA